MSIFTLHTLIFFKNIIAGFFFLGKSKQIQDITNTMCRTQTYIQYTHTAGGRGFHYNKTNWKQSDVEVMFTHGSSLTNECVSMCVYSLLLRLMALSHFITCFPWACSLMRLPDLSRRSSLVLLKMPLAVALNNKLGFPCQHFTLHPILKRKTVNEYESSTSKLLNRNNISW